MPTWNEFITHFTLLDGLFVFATAGCIVFAREGHRLFRRNRS